MGEKEINELSSKVVLTSLPVFKIIIAICLIILGYANFLVFGVEGGRHPIRGATLMFEGVSYFFTVGLPLILLGFGMLLKYLIKAFHPKIALKTHINYKTENNSLEIEEQTLYSKKNFEIPLKNLKACVMDNFSLDRKKWLLILFIPYFMYTFSAGPANLRLPFIEEFPITGFMILFSSIFALIFLILILNVRPLKIYLYITDGYYLIEANSMRNRTLLQLAEDLKNTLGLSREPQKYEKMILNRNEFKNGILLLVISLSGIFLLHTSYSILGDYAIWTGFILSLGLITHSRSDFVITNDSSFEVSQYLSSYSKLFFIKEFKTSSQDKKFELFSAKSRRLWGSSSLFLGILQLCFIFFMVWDIFRILIPITTQDPQYLPIGGRMVFGFTLLSLLLVYFSFEWLRKHHILKIKGGQKEWTIRLISKKERV